MAERLVKKYLDLLAAFPYGINSGVAPLLLPREQCSFAINTTFRGGYATDRPPVQKLTLDFGGDAAMELAFRKGFFQGAAPAGYRPDFGPTQNVVQISGRLFTLTENGAVWDVREITIPGDPNDATTNQVWMWQSEKWLIISDGSAKLPIFYDGVTTRRSYGPSVVLGTTLAVGNFPSPRVIGETITLTLTAPYTGPYNVPVYFNNAFYQPTQQVANATALLTNVSATPGSTIAADQPIVVRSGYSAVTKTNASGYQSQFDISSRIILSLDNSGFQAGDLVTFSGPGMITPAGEPDLYTNAFLVKFSPSGTIEVVLRQDGYGHSAAYYIPAGTLVSKSTNVPNVVIGTLKASFVVPPNVVNLSATNLIQSNSTNIIGYPNILYYKKFTNLSVSNTNGFVVGDMVIIKPLLNTFNPLGVYPFQILAIGAGTLTLQTTVLNDSSGAYTIPAGALIARQVQEIDGGSVQVTIDPVYTGPAQQLVWIGNVSFLINSISTAGSTTLYLINLSDTTDAGAAIPAEDILSVPELPAGRMGAYGMGQNWFSSVDGLAFGPSDLVGSSSGTPAYNYRDAVLRTTDLDVMGYFRLPNAGEIITSMTFVATLDQALGQGPLQVGVASGMFSCMAPFTLIDFQGLGTVNPIANPILTKSLIGFGPVAQNSTVLANSDTIFRSFEGVNSLILARRDFSDLGGNTPISREMTRAIDGDENNPGDNKSLLSYSSAIVFDNRLRMTCAPNVSAQGVFHMGELVLNYDLLSTLRGKAQPVWDGLWTGTNVLQYTQGLFGSLSRAFAFTFNLTDSQIELYELLPTGTQHFDNGDTRIKWVVETPVIFNASVKTLTDLARLLDGEMYLSDVNGRVDVTVLYRPVFYPCWRPWHTFAVCADMSADNAKQQVRYALGFGEPDPKDCDPVNNQPFRDAVGFQLRFEFTGHAKLWASKFLSEEQPSPAFTKPAGCVEPVCLPLNCDVEDDLRLYSLDGLPPQPLPPLPPLSPLAFGNDALEYCCTCPP